MACKDFFTTFFKHCSLSGTSWINHKSMQRTLNKCGAHLIFTSILWLKTPVKATDRFKLTAWLHSKWSQNQNDWLLSLLIVIQKNILNTFLHVYWELPYSKYSAWNMQVSGLFQHIPCMQKYVIHAWNTNRYQCTSLLKHARFRQTCLKHTWHRYEFGTLYR